MSKKIAFISSNIGSIKSFLNISIKKLSKKNFIYIYSNRSEVKSFSDFESKTIRFIHIPINRNISLFSDLKCFFKLLFYMFRDRPDITITLTPKGGLLGIATSFLTFVKKRVHYFTGQVWVTKKGLLKKLLKLIDKIIFNMCTDVLSDSYHQKKFLEDKKIVSQDSLKVLANGSICGVDTSRFYPNTNYRSEIRKNYNISSDSIILLFLGRLSKDKGILDLVNVFNEILIKKISKDIFLFLVGSDEENIKIKIEALCKKNLKKIFFIEFTDYPEKYMAAADIFCLPSYREGFGMAALEASACELPVITSKIYGLIDAVKENHTGLFHEVKNKEQMKRCIIRLVEDEKLRETLGKQGRERVLKDFQQEYVTNEFVKFIQNL